MYTESEGIVLKQIKTLNGRRMIVIFSEKYGKITAGTSISEKGKSKSALALRAFTHGRYEFYKNRDSFSINSAEALKCYYEIGEDVDKYLAASCALEITDLLLEEEQPSKGLYVLLKDYLELLSKRKSAYGTLLLGFQIRALGVMGCMPRLKSCVNCQSTTDLIRFSVSEGGCICKDCCKDSFPAAIDFQIDQAMLSVLAFMAEHPLSSLKDLALKEDTEARIRKIIRSYYSYHLGIDKLKSEGFIV